MSNLQIELAKVNKASRTLINLTSKKRNEILRDVADAIVKNSHILLAENEKDLARMDRDDPKYDRLLLNLERLEDIASDMRNVADLENPLNRILDERKHENGMKISKVSVPLGVIGIIYEARPNVTFDVFALCFKSGNACVLKGGSDAIDSNTAGVKVIHDVLEKHEVDRDCLYLLGAGREEAQEMMESDGMIDVIIPRGSQGLINHVRANSKIPVIETGAGIVHTYVDASADPKMAAEIVYNAKTRRPSVCNALDCLVLHEDHLINLGDIVGDLAKDNVEIFADVKAYAALDGEYPHLKKANDESFGTEFLGYKMSIKTVSSVEEAVEHIGKYSSKHSEAIVCEDKEVADYFLKNVDAAAVYHNVSTTFTDGAQFGLGAEIGISTQKLHARGPMSINELTSYKWVVSGDGQVRSK